MEGGQFWVGLKFILIATNTSAQYYKESLFKFLDRTFLRGAPIAQLGERLTLDRNIAGSILTWGVVLSLSKTLHPHCLVLVKPRKPSQND